MPFYTAPKKLSQTLTTNIHLQTGVLIGGQPGVGQVPLSGTYTNHWIQGAVNDQGSGAYPTSPKFGYRLIERSTGALTQIWNGSLVADSSSQASAAELPSGVFGGEYIGGYIGSQIHHSSGPVVAYPALTGIPTWNASTDAFRSVYLADTNLIVVFFHRTSTSMGKTNQDLYFTRHNGSAYSTPVKLTPSGLVNGWATGYAPQYMFRASSTIAWFLFDVTDGNNVTYDYVVGINISTGAISTAVASSGIPYYIHAYLGYTKTPYGSRFNDGTYDYDYIDEIRTGGVNSDIFCFRYNTTTAPSWLYTLTAPLTEPAGFNDESHNGVALTYNSTLDEGYFVVLWCCFTGTKTTSPQVCNGTWSWHFQHRKFWPHASRASVWSSVFPIPTASFSTTSLDYYFAWSNQTLLGADDPSDCPQCMAFGPAKDGHSYPTWVYSYFYKPQQGHMYFQRYALAVDFWQPADPTYVDATVVCTAEDSCAVTGFTDTIGFLTCQIQSQAIINESVSTIADQFYVRYTVESFVAYNDGEVICTVADQTLIDGLVSSFIDGALVCTTNDSLLVSADVSTFISGELVVTITDSAAIDGSVEATLYRDFHAYEPKFGTDWHAEFLEIANAYRSDYSLPPLKLFTRAMYQAYEDVAQTHSENMKEARWFAHDDTGGTHFPVGYRLFAERSTITTAEAGAENIQLRAPNLYYDPDNLTTWHQYPYLIITDKTFPTPQEAFDSWWTSSGHRANLLRDWGSEDAYSLMGFAWGPAPTNVGLGEPALSSNWFYLTHVMLRYGPEQVGMKDRSFHANYDAAGALIEYFNATYDTSAYVEVKQSHSTVYSLRVGYQHSANYGTNVAAQHEAPIHYSLMAAHEAPYTQTMQVKAASESSYELKATDSVKQAHTANWTLKVTAANEAPYGTPPQVRANLISPYGDSTGVRVSMIMPYAGMVPVRGAHTVPYALMGDVRAALVSPYEFTSTVKASHSSDYDVLSVEPVRREFRSFYSLLSGDTSFITPTASVVKNGVVYEVEDAVVSTDEASYAWVARIRFSEMSAYMAISEGDAITLNFGGETYALVVTGKSIKRNAPANVDLQMVASSPTVKFDAPNAAPTSYLINTSMPVRDIVEQILGEAVTWELVNWQVPANRIQFEGVTPLEAVRTIVAAAGGIVQTTKGGTILIRSMYPIPTSMFTDATPAHVFTDEEDNLSVAEEYVFREAYNEFRIREGEASFGDTLDYEKNPEDPSRGTLHFYPSPWRDNFTIRSTSTYGATLLDSLSVVLKSETVLVEFKDGVAPTQYPIKTITGVVWKSDSLGSLSYAPYGRSISAASTVNEGYGLAEVTYDYESYDYAVTGVLGTSVQFIVEDV